MMAELQQQRHSSAVQHSMQTQTEVIAYRHTERKGESKAQKLLGSLAHVVFKQTATTAAGIHYQDCKFGFNSMGGEHSGG